MAEQNAGPGQFAGAGQLDEAFWDNVTLRDKYFKPENNVDYDLLLRKWRPVVMQGKDSRDGPKKGLSFDVIRINGVECAAEPKNWTTTSARVLREFEPVVKAALKVRKEFLHVKFRKSVPRDGKDTDAVFTVQNLDVDLDPDLQSEQRSNYKG